MEFDDFFRDTWLNMVIAWLITGVIGLVFVQSLFSFDILWMVFTSFLLAVVVLPPIIYRSRYAVLPWELILITAVPVLVRTLSFSVLSGRIATFISLAALALVIAVELHVFTSVKFSHGFAVVFLIVSTLALEGIWSLTRFYMDILLRTSFLTTNEALMAEWAEVTLAGFMAGLLLDFYFQRRDKILRKNILKVVHR